MSGCTNEGLLYYLSIMHGGKFDTIPLDASFHDRSQDSNGFG